MQTKLLVRNLAWDTTDAHLEQAFGVHGPVVSAQIVKDNSSGEARGFAFVEMGTQVAAEAAIKYLNLRELNGRQLNVRFADDCKGKGGKKKRW